MFPEKKSSVINIWFYAYILNIYLVVCVAFNAHYVEYRVQLVIELYLFLRKMPKSVGL